jgi:type IV pilus assembly protein PilM
LLFSKPTKSIGIDIGTHSVKAVQVAKTGGRLKVEIVGFALINRSQLNVDPVMAHAEAMRTALDGMALNQSVLVGALPGQTVVVRYPRLRSMPAPQLNAAVEKEAGQNIPYDLSEVFLDWTVLDHIEENKEDQLKILLVAAKHEVIDARVQLAEAANIQYSVLTVDSLALADAAQSCGYLPSNQTVALINTGASATSIHFVKDGVSNFIRDISWGSREMIQAIAKSRRCDFDEADRLLRNYVRESEHEILEAMPPMPSEEAELEPVPEASSLSNSSLLDPLDEELGDLSGPTAPPPQRFEPESGEKAIADILTVPVSRLVSEIRRSLDYYEHQLYERPVDKVIISGGVADVRILREALEDDLGLEHVAVANPAESDLRIGSKRSVEPLIEHPAQFMVAIGLAARGTANL